MKTILSYLAGNVLVIPVHFSFVIGMMMGLVNEESQQSFNWGIFFDVTVYCLFVNFINYVLFAIFYFSQPKKEGSRRSITKENGICFGVFSFLTVSFYMLLGSFSFL